MNTGDRFDISMYQVLATADVAHGGGSPMEGNVVLLTNNSSHFIMAWRENLGSTEATVIGATSYVDCDDERTTEIYIVALRTMVDLAASR